MLTLFDYISLGALSFFVCLAIMLILDIFFFVEVPIKWVLLSSASSILVTLLVISVFQNVSEKHTKESIVWKNNSCPVIETECGKSMYACIVKVEQLGVLYESHGSFVRSKKSC